jgi:hypothetical protein
MAGVFSSAIQTMDTNFEARQTATNFCMLQSWGTSWGYEARDDKSLAACFARRYGDRRSVFRISAAALAVS